MKPRSKKEREFVEMAGQLRPLSDRQKEWAKSLFPSEALYYSRRGNSCEFHCMCCGAVVRQHIQWNLVDQVCDWTCPECGNRGNSGNYCPECGRKRPDKQD